MLKAVRKEQARRTAERERRRIDEQAEAIRSRCTRLSGFVAEAWHVLEPTTTFRPNWHIEAITEHLEAVTSGEINRLLINVPPGSSKSLLASVMFQAWEWGPAGMPSLRYLATSFNDGPVKRDTRKCRDLILSEWYRALWPEVVLTRTGETSFQNSRTGTREGLAFGSLTSQRGDRLICFPEWEMIETERGPIAIGEIVSRRMDVRVWSADVRTGEVSLKPVIGWVKNPGSDLVEVGLSDGSSVTCTPGHRIWTDRGWVRADSLRASDRLPVAAGFNHLNGATGYPVTARQCPLGIGGSVDVNHLVDRQFGPRSCLAAPVVSRLANFLGEFGPRFATPDLTHRRWLDAVRDAQFIGGQPTRGDGFGSLAGDLGPGSALIGRECPVPFGVGYVRGACAIGKVLKAAVCRIPAEVADFFAGLWRALERQHDALVHEEHFGRAVAAGVEPRVTAFAGRRAQQDALFDRPFDAVLHGRPGSCLSANATHVADAVVAFEPDYRTPLFVRCAGHVESTYCLTVKDNHTFFAGDGNRVLVANCDDPHSTDTAESPTERATATRRFREGAVNRLNDQERSAIVVIMQRLHEEDISGVIHSLDMGYVHLCLPMEFEPDRRCVTSIGFSDPRTEEGELLDPSRFPADTVEKLKRDMGSYAFAGQYQQNPRPRQGGMFQRADFEVVDSVPAGGRSVRAWDFAATKEQPGRSPDWTVGLKATHKDGVFYIEDVVRARWSPMEVERALKNTATQDGIRVTVRMPEDPGAAGKADAAAKVKLLAGYPVKVVRRTGEKTLWARPAAAQSEAGNIKIVRGAWNEAFLDEVSGFPAATHDDQVDALADAVNELALGHSNVAQVGSYRMG